MRHNVRNWKLKLFFDCIKHVAKLIFWDKVYNIIQILLIMDVYTNIYKLLERKFALHTLQLIL